MDSPSTFTSSTHFSPSFSYAITSSIDGTTVVPTPIVTQGMWPIQIIEISY